MIKAIIFDYGNVIEKLDNSIFTKRISSFSIFDSSAIFRLIFEENIIQKKYETGSINSEEFFHSITELCKLNIQIDDFRKAYTEIFTPVPETIELIKHLKKKYKIGLISNTSEWDYEYAIKKKRNI